MAEVNGGVVTLRGIVHWAYQKSYAEAIARRVPGVVNTGNNIAIRSSVQFSLSTFQP
jgi:osmotically-inducible protein OsmY